MSSTHRSKDDFEAERENDVSSGLARFHGEINRVADEFFYRLGHWVATFPKRTLAIGLICVALCCTGFLNFAVESSADDLWVPAESLSRTQEEVVLTYFDEGFKYAVILLEHPDTGGNVLTKESMDIFWELNAETLRVETGEGHRFADLCLLDFDGETCAQPLRGVARFWGSSFEAYNATVRSDADVLEAVNVPRFPDGGAVSLEAIFGNTITFDDEMAVTSARVMTQSYEVAASLSVDDEYGEVYEWEGLFQDGMRKKAAEIESVNVAYFTGRSMDDSLAESVSGEVFLFVVTYTIMVLFVMLGLGRCRSGAVERRSWLGFGGVCIVVASGLAAYGINSGFGVPFTSLSQILPFILVGIGVDDMFVMLASFDHTNPTLPVEERMAVALRRSGVSITYSSLTNFSAFMLGSFTVLPAVEYFCLYAGTAILFDFILQVTAFPALLVLDTNRQTAGRLDWCCCLTSAKYLKERAETGASLPIADEECPPVVPINKGGSDRRNQDAESGRHPARAAALALAKSRSTAFKRKGGEERSDVHHLTGLGRWMKDVYAPFLLSAKGKTLVLLSFAGLLSSGFYGVAEVTQGFNVLDVAPDEHFARTYKELAIGYALDQDSQYVPLTIYTPAVDYTDVNVQAIIQGTDALMVNQKHFSGPVNSWLTSFTKWADNSTEYRGNISSVYGFKVYNDRSTFYSALAAFTSDGDSAAYLADLSFSESGEIEMSRSGMYLVDISTTASSVDAINSARKVISLSPLQPSAFAYSPLFVYFEQYLVIYKELITNFLLALAAVAVLSLLVLGRFRIVLLVCFTVVMIDIELLGFVHHWGLQVNGITVIELIMAVGLVVDYMVHIVHYYLLQDPEIEKDLRIGRALGEIGPSVTIGAATTFLGIMPMAFASNSIFRVFFKMFIVIIIFGYVHGVIFVPVALSMLPDSSAVRYLASGEGGREAVGAEVKEEEADPMGLHFAIAAAAAAAAAAATETKLHVCVVCSAAQVPGEMLEPAPCDGGGGGGGGGGGCGCRGGECDCRGRGSSATNSSERRRRGVATVAPGSVAGEGGGGFCTRADPEGGSGGGGGGDDDGRVTPEDGSRSSFDGDGYSSFSHTTFSSLSTGTRHFGGGCVGGGSGSRGIDEAHRTRTRAATDEDGSHEEGREAGGDEGERRRGGDRKLNERMDTVHYSLSNENRRLGPRFRAEPRREPEQPLPSNLGSRSESNNSLARFESRSSSVSTLNSLAWSSSMLSRNSSLVSATNSLFATGPIYPAPGVSCPAAGEDGSIPLDVQQQQQQQPPSRSPLSSSSSSMMMMRHRVGELMDPAVHRWSLQQPPSRTAEAAAAAAAAAAVDPPKSPDPSYCSEKPMERREGFKMWPSKKTRQTIVPWTWQVD